MARDRLQVRHSRRPRDELLRRAPARQPLVAVHSIVAAAIARRKAAELADPIRFHHFSSKQAREMFIAVLFEEIEFFLRSGNFAGKSSAGAFLGVCLARGIRRIDGRTINEATPGHAEYIAQPQWIELPTFPVPNVGVLIVQSYEQAGESIVPAYLKWIGSHPHKLRYGSQGEVVGMRVKPDRVTSDNPRKWSRIMLFPKKGQVPTGLRILWAQGDEPPPEKMWREIRARRMRGMPLFRWITATPLDRTEWEWLQKDFANEESWQREIEMPFTDNQALSDYDIKQLLDTFKNDPFAEARIYGKYVDLTAHSPFLMQIARLKLWKLACENPLQELEVHLRAELPIEGKRGVFEQDAWGHVYFWEKPRRGAEYWVIGDPALGIPNPLHDRNGAHVYRLYPGKPKLVARYNGNCGPFGLGWLMADLAERYNDAMVDFDSTGGYGTNVLSGLSRYRSEKHPDGYPHIARQIRDDKIAEHLDPRYGYATTVAYKNQLLGTIRVLLDGDVVTIPSRAVIDCLLDARVDEHQRLFKPPGVKYEDLTILGHFGVRWMQLNPSPPPVAVNEKVQEMFRRELGREVVLPDRGPTKKRAYPRMRWRRS